MSNIVLSLISRIVSTLVKCRVTWWIGHSIAQTCRFFARIQLIGRVAKPIGRVYNICLLLKDRCEVVGMREGALQIQGLRDLINWVGDSCGLVMVEVGSYKGESAELFLKSGKFVKIYCVDPWQSLYDPSDLAAYSDMIAVEKSFDQRFYNEKRIVKVKGTIDDLLHRFPDLRPDMYYVDGCHTYEGVKHDLGLILKSKPPQKFLCGHDFVDGWAGCKRAVLEMVGQPDATFMDGSWAKIMY